MTGDLIPAPVAQLGSFSDGQAGMRQSWTQYLAEGSIGLYGFSNSYGAVSTGASYAARNPHNRESAIARAVTQDLVMSDPTLASLAQQIATMIVGEGLRFSAKPLWAKLGITEAQGQQLSKDIEQEWEAWSRNPRECHLEGTHSLHALAYSAAYSMIVTGEILSIVDWRSCRDARTKTKVQLLAPEQLDETKNTSGPNFGVYAGVHFANNRVEGYWLRQVKIGQSYPQPMAKFERIATTWGRPRVLHLFEAISPGQVRGVSMLQAALTPSREKNILQETVLVAAQQQNKVAMTVKSDLDASAAFAKLDNAPDASQLFNQVALQQQTWYERQKINLAPGSVNHLAPGDELIMQQSKAPGNNYLDFDRSLARTSAAAAGSVYSILTGDYSQESFSSSRMAYEVPHRIMLRRRQIVIRWYAAIFEAWLEEACQTGVIALPPDAEPFYAAKSAYCNGKWLGLGRTQPDPKKAAEANILLVENNMATLSDVLAENGQDFDEVVAQRKYEVETLEAAGLPKFEQGAVSTQNRRQELIPPDERDED